MLNICTQCQQHMINHLEALISIVLAVDNSGIPSDAAMELLKGAVLILCNLPSKQITEPLMKVCNMQLEGLQKVLANDTSLKGSKSSPLFWLDRFTAIFRTIRIRNISDNVHPCQPVVQQVWPSFQACLNKHQHDSKITESCCRALRFALRCTEKYSSLILADVVNTVIINSYF